MRIIERSGRKKILLLSIFALLFLVLFLQPSLFAFLPNGGFKYFRNYPPDEYNRHPLNWIIIQDKQGIIYVGNQAGVMVFDGVSWRIINVPNWRARSLAIGNDGTIYVGGLNEIGFLSPDAKGTLKYESLLSQVEDNHKNFKWVYNISRTREGIYFRTYQYLFRWDPQGKQMKTWPADDRFGRIFVIAGKLFVQQRETGLMQMKNDLLEEIPGGNILAGKKLSMLSPYGPESRELLIGTREHGFYIYNGQTIEPFPTGVDDYVKEKQLYHGIGLSSSPGDFALATLRGGLRVIDSRGNIKSIYNKSWGILSDNVKYVYEDSQGNLWLALEKGISKIEHASPITIYDDRSDLPGLVLAVTKHKTGTWDFLYAGTTQGLYYLESTGKFHPVPGISGMCHSLLPVRDSLLAAADPGVFQVENGQVKRKVINARSYVLVQSGAVPNRIWVGTEQGLISLYSETGSKQWKRELIFEDITTDIRTIVEDPEGNLWLGTETKGVIKVDFAVPPQAGGAIDHHPVTPYHTSHGLPSGRVSVYRAADHVMFATDKGVFRFDAETNHFIPDMTFGEEFANGSRNVFRIAAEKNKNNIWFHSQGRNFQATSQPDGSLDVDSTPFLRIPLTQVNHIYPEDEGNCTWFAANDGLFCFDTRFEKNYQRPYEILIRRVMVNERIVFNNFKSIKDKDSGSDGFSLILPHRDRQLQFQCAASFFENESATRYRYFLEGYDKSWSAWISRAQKDYVNLDPGTYRFQVQARNVYNNLSSKAFFRFKILPPWYQTWWAYCVYVFLFGLLFYFAVKWRKATQEIEAKNRQLEAQTGRLEIQAKELQEMASVRTRFFANISHEFRTPLTLIMGPLEQMLSQCTDDRQKKRLEMMRRNSQRLLALINQLLALSKIDKGKMKLKAFEQHIVPFLKGILASFHLAAAYKKIDLDFSAESEDITLYFDPEKLEDIFCNLLLNVVNLTPDGEKITAAVKKNQAETREAESSAGPVFLEISLCVSGFEIPAEQLEHIFDRFYLAEETFEHRSKGYGIGLALARELVSLHHGEILARQVESESKGTEFIIRLPMGKDHLESEEIVDASLFPSNFKGPREIPLLPPLEKEEVQDEPAAVKELETAEKEEKILILLVEDNADTSDFISDSLEPLYNVEQAENGREGIRKARELIPDLIVSDIIMPYVDGYELCRVLKNDVRTSHIPVLLLTAKGGEEDILRGLETGADDYITKPFNTRQLHARIKNLIDLRRQWQLKIERQMGLQLDEISVSSMDEAFIKEMHEVIEKNLSDPEFNVEQLAKKLYMSRATLYRKIHALTGEPPHRFIRSYRLKRAAQLLKAKFGNVGEVAQEVGITNISYFSQCFKEKFHQLPSEFQDIEFE
ncbi:MAG: response regulator [Candidatus Aminicenantes bacterium]|nr:response regulator [Candidatus Aminicenantes bacterium]NIM82072.1 response regulator [Candidatus Aminicenantes bacterium]NIN18286.1 response regulator [Candidatus Aminicenantes bacterium]NIN42183.1 response regulator [Candidatus Aminicenantes bacterium]NIN84939.1 response regulator [Candidatus Aminicenantes bacterium]